MAWFGHASQLCIEDDELMMFMACVYIHLYVYHDTPPEMIQAPEKKVVGRPTCCFFGGHLFRNQIRPTADLTIKCGVLEGT